MGMTDYPMNGCAFAFRIAVRRAPALSFIMLAEPYERLTISRC